MPGCSSSSSCASTSAPPTGGAFSLELLDERPGLVVLRATGRGAADFFAGEVGGHRWQRVPPTEKRGRVHSSTITVAVLPVPTETELVIDPSDLDWSACRASGKGGQNLQKTNSAIQLTHRPSGIQVRCESERSAHHNRAAALAALRARLAADLRTRTTAARDRARRLQIGTGMRADKRRTIRVQDGTVIDHLTQRTWPLRAYTRGRW
jgi:peptide chain release factor 1